MTTGHLKKNSWKCLRKRGVLGTGFTEALAENRLFCNLVEILKGAFVFKQVPDIL